MIVPIINPVMSKTPRELTTNAPIVLVISKMTKNAKSEVNAFTKYFAICHLTRKPIMRDITNNNISYTHPFLTKDRLMTIN